MTCWFEYVHSDGKIRQLVSLLAYLFFLAKVKVDLSIHWSKGGKSGYSFLKVVYSLSPFDRKFVIIHVLIPMVILFLIFQK